MALAAIMTLVGVVFAGDGWSGSVQQTFRFATPSAMTARVGVSPGMVAEVDSASSLGHRWFVAGAASALPAPTAPYSYPGQGGVTWVEWSVAAQSSAFSGTIAWTQIVPSSIPSTLAGHQIVNGVTVSRAITASSSGPITVNSGTSTTLAGDVALGFNWGSPVGLIPGGSNSAGTIPSAARADHRHAVPTGSTSGTLAAGDDLRLSNDRVASGLRSASSVVAVSSATAPSQYQVLTGNSATSASWQTLTGNSIADNALSPGKLTLGGENQIIASSGLLNYWTVLTDALHGSRGGGSLHLNATTLQSGFMGPGDKVNLNSLMDARLVTFGSDYAATLPNALRLVANNISMPGTDGSNILLTIPGPNQLSINAFFGSGHGQYMQGDDTRVVNAVQTSRTISTTAPLTGGGALTNNLQLGISPASSSSPGTMGSAQVVKLDGIPADAVSGQRTLSAIAPLRIDGGPAANLTSNRTLTVSVVSSTGSGVVPAATNTGYVLAGVSGGAGWVHPNQLDLINGAGTSGYVPKFLGLHGIGDSGIYDMGSALRYGYGYYGHAFVPGAEYKHVTVGTSYFDGTNWVTPAAGSNAIAEMYTDTSGIAFLTAPNTGNSTRNESHATFKSRERMRVHDGGVAVYGSLRVEGGSPTADALFVSTDAVGNGSWRSVAGMGLVKNGDNWAYFADGLKVAAKGSQEITGAFVGYPTQSSSHGDDVYIKAQTSGQASGGNGGNVYISGGNIPGGGTGAPGGVYLTAGTNGSKTGDVTVQGAALLLRLQGSTLFEVPPSGVLSEERWYPTVTTTGNHDQYVAFYGLRGDTQIPTGTYHLEYTVMTSSASISTTAKYNVTLRQSGGLSLTEAYPVANPQGIVFDPQVHPSGTVFYLVFRMPGADNAIVNRWDVRLNVTKHTQ